MGHKHFNKTKHKFRRKRLRHSSTFPEQALWKYLKAKQLNVKFRRQLGIGNYIVDFCCVEMKLVIEIDGDSHFTDDAVRYDKVRTSFIEGVGF
jgi:very-short-patch-repair endonuclease